MDNYFTSFRLLTNNIRATRVFNKIGYANALSLRANICKKKRNVATLNRAHQAKKPCEPKRFVWCWNKVEKIYIP